MRKGGFLARLGGIFGQVRPGWRLRPALMAGFALIAAASLVPGGGAHAQSLAKPPSPQAAAPGAGGAQRIADQTSLSTPMLSAPRGQSACPAADLPAIALPATATALANNQPVLIVALGSSSTRGWMSSGIGRSYPAVLQRRLADARPFAEFSVVNRGVGGQTAADELARLDDDVIALHPQLVIWQTGANDALRGVAAEKFRAIVGEGVARLHAAGIDVVLMDNQRVPRLLALPLAARLNRVLADIAAAGDAALFSRDALMQQWADAQGSLVAYVAHDGLHMNDLGYACTADALAHVIADALPARTLRSYPPR